MSLPYRAHRRAEVLAVGASSAPWARTDEPEIGSPKRHELRLELCTRGERVPARILSSWHTGDRIARNVGSRKKRADRGVPRTVPGTGDPVLAAGRDVVREYEAEHRRAVDLQEAR